MGSTFRKLSIISRNISDNVEELLHVKADINKAARKLNKIMNDLNILQADLGDELCEFSRFKGKEIAE